MGAVLHPDLAAEERRRLLIEGVDRFNAERWYDAHEAWEEVWRSTRPEPKDLLQGLIQVAVGMLHHRERHRPAVARRVLGKGRMRIAPHRPSALGLDLERLLADVDHWRGWLERCDGEPPPPPRLSVIEASELR